MISSRDLNAFRTDMGQLSTRKLEAELKRLEDAPTFKPGYLLEDMASGAWDAAEDDRWAQIGVIRDELAGREGQY